MATYYLKNTSGTTVTVTDLGLMLPDSRSLVIDSNAINGYLTSDMAAKINDSSLILSTTDIGDNGGDMSIPDAIAALSLVSKVMRNNPTQVTFTQASDADPLTDITALEAETLTDGSDAGLLHKHDNQYWTKVLLEGANAGTVKVNWDNITNTPTFGAMQWVEPVQCNLQGMDSTPPASPQTGWFYLDTDDKHIYKYDGTSWIDQGAPVLGDRVIFRDGTASNDYIYEYDGFSWGTGTAPGDNWSVLVDDDGDNRPAQYAYTDNEVPPNWVRIADVNWGEHNVLAGRDDTGSHPASAISYINSTSGLTATTIQDAIDEIATEQGVELSNILFVAKDGNDSFTGGTLGTIANPFATIQAAINAVPTTGIGAASSTNRYAVYVFPGDYSENVSHGKSWVYIVGADKKASRIKSSTGNTISLSSTSEGSTGLYNISIVSDSSETTDNGISISGNNPIIHNVDVTSVSGARTIYVSGAFNQSLTHVFAKNGEVRIDAGIVKFTESTVVDAKLNVTNGTVIINDGDFSYSGGDAIDQSNGTVYLVSAKLSSGSSAKDYNQSAGTVYWGWVEYNPTKVTLNGTKTLLFIGKDLYYSNTISGMVATNVQDAIDELDDAIGDAGTALTTHINNTTNPHDVTLTQVIAEETTLDSDLTVTNLTTLVNAGNADALHIHAASAITYDNATSELSAINVQGAIDELDDDVRKRFHSSIYVDKHRIDTYLANGSQLYPYKTIAEATAVATNGVAIYVSEGTYTENIVLPEGAGLIGAGSSKTYLEGTLTTTSKATSRLMDFSLRNTFTLTGRAQVMNVYCGAQVFINGVTDPCEIECRNFTIKSDTGVALTVGNNVALIKFSSGGVATEDGSSAITIASGVVAFDKYNIEIRTTPSANAGIALSGTATLHIHQSLIQTTGGSPITSTATNTLPNIISDTQYAGGAMNFNNSPTIIEGAHDLMGAIRIPSGNALIKRPGEQIDYTNTTSGLAATNVQGAIDEIKGMFADTIGKGTVFPTVPAPDAGDLFYRTDLSLFFQYDGTRSEWLSVAQMFLDWGSASADGTYCSIHGATATQTGYLMPRNGKIISITARCASGNQAKVLEIRRNHNSVAPLKSFALSSGSYSSITENIDFVAGDYIQAFAQSNSIPARDLVIMAVISWVD